MAVASFALRAPFPQLNPLQSKKTEKKRDQETIKEAVGAADEGDEGDEGDEKEEGDERNERDDERDEEMREMSR